MSWHPQHSHMVAIKNTFWSNKNSPFTSAGNDAYWGRPLKIVFNQQYSVRACDELMTFVVQSLVDIPWPNGSSRDSTLA